MHKNSYNNDFSPPQRTANQFRCATGSCVGRAHQLAQRNGQDAAALFNSNAGTVLVVTDGCGSAPFSELGARWGANYICAALAQGLEGPISRSAHLTLDVMLPTALEALAVSMTPPGASLIDTLQNSLLFTFLAAVITPTATTVLGVGDGTILLNRTAMVLESGPENAPDYIAYRVVDGHRRRSTVRTFLHRATTTVQSLAIATDGALPLVGDPTADSSLCSLVTTLAIDRNPSLLQKRLRALALVPGLLEDDTTVAFARRETSLEAEVTCG